MFRAAVLLVAVAFVSCAPADGPATLTFSGSAVGLEADVLRTQLARFSAERHFDVGVRPTPDSADHRHQLYVQWLNARAPAPDVLQLDVIWTPEFAAAGWLLPLDGFSPATGDFFPASIRANRWRGTLYALPWFVDVGMLYWRTDLFPGPPATFDALSRTARTLVQSGRVRYGVVWQAARYEGLITVFLEHLGGFGGEILDERGAVVVDSEAAVRALTWMRDAIHADAIVPPAVLTWQEEQTRFAFQNGAAAAMRNWPYARTLLNAADSGVAGKFGISPMPATADGRPTAALGGSQLAINARSRRPDDAWALIEFLTAPAQMLERARIAGQFPSRSGLYAQGTGLDRALGIDSEAARRLIDAALPRPVTPVYTQLSEILQIRLHQALSRQEEPRVALAQAAREMRALLARTGLEPSADARTP